VRGVGEVVLDCVSGAECYVDRGVVEDFGDESSFGTGVGEEGPFWGGLGVRVLVWAGES
jgi:hypothetical protein